MVLTGCVCEKRLNLEDALAEDDSISRIHLVYTTSESVVSSLLSEFECK